MTPCVVCRPADDGTSHEPAEGWLCCWRAWARMAASLRLIPDLCDELSGLGYVMRDGPAFKVLYPPGHKRSGEPVEHSDPIALRLPAGPLNGSKSAPRVSGSTERPVPIRIDPTDLLARSRPGSLPIAATGYYAQDQIGHLAVATELEFWARDWADIRREGIPLPTVPELCGWLLHRLEWACGLHPAVDEFAGQLFRIRSSLTAAAGRFDAPPEAMNAPCWGCHRLTLIRDTDIERIVCGQPSEHGCWQVLTYDGYSEYAQRLIKENPS